MPKYNVAVRPSDDKLQRIGLERSYYEGRNAEFEAETPLEACQLYIDSRRAKYDKPEFGIKKGDLIWLTDPEIPFLKAVEVVVPFRRYKCPICEVVGDKPFFSCKCDPETRWYDRAKFIWKGL